MNSVSHTLAVEIGAPNFDRYRQCSFGMGTAKLSSLIQKDDSIARLTHFTFWESLRARLALYGPANSTMAETCLSYLNSQPVKTLSVGTAPNHKGSYI